jgi:hypothetical protein
MVSTMAVTFHINIPCNKTFPWVPKIYLVTLILVFELLIKNFKLGFIIWMVCTWALIFHMRVFSVGTNRFDLVTLVFDLHFQTFNPAYSIYWIVCTTTLIFQMNQYELVLPCDLDLYVWVTCWKLYPWLYLLNGIH